MRLSRLVVNNVRNIEHVDLNLNSHINVFEGANGSGKTSLLESVYLLGYGRTFRGSSSKPMIRMGQDNLASFAQSTDADLGVEKTKTGRTRIQINSEPVQSSVELAKILPIQLLNPDNFRLLEAGPQERRRFLDWGVFHVEHSFMNHWSRMKKALKQRNHLLRHGSLNMAQLASWEEMLVTASYGIDQMRQVYLAEFMPLFQHMLGQLLDFAVSIEYHPGWPEDEDLADLYVRRRAQEQKIGYTQLGAHRADLRITFEGFPAVATLSRGQQKLVVCAMQLAQGALLRDKEKSCIYLVDDLSSELDQSRRAKLLKLLSDLNAQVLLTVIQADLLPEIEVCGDSGMFHVEHGQVRTTNGR